MSASSLKALIYDLDGTLVDSMPGIAMSFRHTLGQLKYPEPSDEEVRLAIGPGLHRALETLLASSDRELINQAVNIYREHHDSIGYKSTTLIPGMMEMVSEIYGCGVPQYVASMKADKMVRPILQYLNSEHFFSDMIGSNPLGSTRSKAEMLAFLGSKYEFSPAEAILIGDTAHDARAAREQGVEFFGITFGYGTRSEMEEIKWGRIFDSLISLREAIMSRITP